MESLEELQKQLSTLGKLHSIVKTMKALSAASIRQYEQSVEALSGYQQTVERGLHVAVKDTAPSGQQRRHLTPSDMAVVVFGSDHGLCGRFNEAITDYALAKMRTASPAESVPLITVGARVKSIFEHHEVPIEESFFLPSSTYAITKTVEKILLIVDQWQQQYRDGQVMLFFNRHHKVRAYEPCEFLLLPFDLEQFRCISDGPWVSNSLPVYSMPHEQLLSKLIHQHLFIAIFRACAESQTSEHASRLSAMKSAQRNLNERLSEVTMDFRHARQTQITSELLDIITGFEMISGND